MSNPWLKFFPTDWRADPALRMCSLEARGLWIELLGLMHEATPRGDLVVSGKAPTLQQVATLTGAPLDVVERAMAELSDAGVYSTTETGTITSEFLSRWDRLSRRPPIPSDIRAAVLDRDGEVCVYCGDTEGPFHIDHVHPWSRGGLHTMANLAVACATCNLAKGAKTVAEFMEGR